MTELQKGPLPTFASDRTLDRARADLLGQFLSYWRSALLALAVVTVVTYWMGRSRASPSAAAIWLACALSNCLLQAAICRAMELTASTAEAMTRWHRWLVGSIALNGLFWGSLPWLVMDAGSEALWLSALLVLMLLFCVASSPGTLQMILSSTLPIVIASTSALLFSGTHPVLAAGYAGLTVLIGFYGLRLNDARMEGLSERFAAQDLAEELKRKQDELQAQQARLVEVERERTLLLERQRLMGDMHDGLGAALVTSLAAVQRGETDPARIAVLLGDCIDDLRAVIESLEPHDHDLAMLLGSMRQRMERRTQAAGLALKWQIDDLPPLPWMGPTEALHVMRFIQEVVSNTIQHSGARQICFVALARGEDLVVRVSDDGHGFAVGSAPRGRGLSLLQQRADKLGGAFDITSSSAAGTTVSLMLPIVRGK